MLERVGWVDAVLVREHEDGYVIVDGHLRADMLPDEQIPCLVLDVDEAEAGEIIATLDPLSAMAGMDVDALTSLLDTMPPLPDELSALLDSMREATESEDPTTQDDPRLTGDGTPQLGNLTFRVMVTCPDEQSQRELVERLELEGLTCQPLML